MKRSIFGMVLLVCGSAGYLTLRIFLSLHPWDYNGITGLRGALLGNNLRAPYVIFCAMGILGLVICIYEAYLRK
ncbi:MAG TPA: hypothetical protein PK597_01020 [Oscillospiraceae bacterium]|nr:hypothetical protein [Oscillospiraceae bacterium]